MKQLETITLFTRPVELTIPLRSWDSWTVDERADYLTAQVLLWEVMADPCEFNLFDGIVSNLPSTAWASWTAEARAKYMRSQVELWDELGKLFAVAQAC